MSFEDKLKYLWATYPDFSNRDLVEQIHNSDRGSLPYWVRFIEVFVVRYGVVLICCVAGGMSWLDPAPADLSEAIVGGLSHSWWYALLDLVVCVGCYRAYKYNPRSQTFEEVLTCDAWQRCLSRISQYIVWSIIFGAVLLFAAIYLSK